MALLPHLVDTQGHAVGECVWDLTIDEALELHDELHEQDGVVYSMTEACRCGSVHPC